MIGDDDLTGALSTAALIHEGPFSLLPFVCRPRCRQLFYIFLAVNGSFSLAGVVPNWAAASSNYRSSLR